MRISLSSAPVGTPWGLAFCFVPFLIHTTSVVLTRFSLRSRCIGAPDRKESVGVAREEEKGSAAEQISVYCTDGGAGDSCKFRKNDPLLPRQGVVQYDDEQPSACECVRVVYLYLYLYLYVIYIYISIYNICTHICIACACVHTNRQQ